MASRGGDDAPHHGLITGDAHEPRLGEGTRRPAMRSLLVEPRSGGVVVHMIRPGESNHPSRVAVVLDVDVQQGDHGQSLSAR